MKIAILGRHAAITLLSTLLLTAVNAYADGCYCFPMTKSQEQFQQEAARPFDNKEFKTYVSDFISKTWERLQNEPFDTEVDKNLVQILGDFARTAINTRRLAMAITSDAAFQTDLAIFCERYKNTNRTFAAEKGMAAPDENVLQNKFILKLKRILDDSSNKIGMDKGFELASKPWMKAIQIIIETPLCFFMGRHVQGKSALPKLKELLTPETLKDFAIGYGTFAAMTFTRELTVGALNKLQGKQPKIFFGGTPSKKKDGENYPTISVTGLDPRSGGTLIDGKLSCRKLSSIAIHSAAAVSEFATYLGIRSLLGTFNSLRDLKTFGSLVVFADACSYPFAYAGPTLVYRIQKANIQTNNK